jgi:phosphate transport system substrate-binding protein
MPGRHWCYRLGRAFAAFLALLLALLPVVVAGSAEPAFASFAPVHGAGSTWSQNAINQWIVDVQNTMSVTYEGTGSSQGRREWLDGTVDFAASDIPFQFHPEDGSAAETPPQGSYAYIPVTAGGTVFMYNLNINGQRVTNLRLSGTNIAKIFTGVITNWNDPAIVADNPALALPNRKIVPVVRSDGSGSTAQFSLWMIAQQGALWNAYCGRTGRTGKCGETSYYPTVPGMVAKPGDLGVASYVAQSYADGAIGYVNYSYALNQQFPVAKMLNAAGYYTEPTPSNVAVSLLQAHINTNSSSPDYLTQQLQDVYADPDPRTYPLSSYSYMILPTTVHGSFDASKGLTLGTFANYAMCEGQQESASLGYSPMPINLVQASFDQIRRVPGAPVQKVNIQQCHNPTFSPDGTNVLARDAPFPAACDKQGSTQCTTGTGGAKAATPPSKSGGGAGGTSGSGNGTGNGTGNGSGNGSGTTGSNTTATTSGTGTGQQCNPDSGTCAADNSNGANLSSDAAASPTTLAAKHGWTDTQTLMLLAALFTAALILAPGLAYRTLSKRNTK